MKKPSFLTFYLLITICFISTLLASCTKGGNDITAVYNPIPHDAVDIPVIEKFLAANSRLDTIVLNHVKKSDSTQLRYMIVPNPRGDSSRNHQPTLDSGVVFNYTLRRLSKPGTLIDSVGAPGYSVTPLSQTLPCLVEGIKYLHRGQRILLFVPSSLGFRDNPTDVTYNLITGEQRTTTVMPNTVLIFDVTLTRISRLTGSTR